ncbi:MULTISPECIES: DeoR/GlpR family DNA-binding transcription regulator [Paenibacillus]|uniref:DeoR/GlpR family DNA-binding transcription regulator n=1 Tax=Paenibacillus TaxID=44249 RepID=UPI0022B8F358|nr:DeoR/GlpR family DNA-binding transcription regulator [Paenibacillus caseinilyticus]MCZ8518267.1 DeoR/GlpR family DNA-binding transcription regulator [Paenibacillus caseinilyticus]
MSLSYEERRRKIVEDLTKHEQVKVPLLAEELGVSMETIRRDLERLDQEGVLKKVYGGAVLARSNAPEPPFEQKKLLHLNEKQAIGRLAASLVEDGDNIMLGNGTTPLEMVRHLSARTGVTLVTHSVPVLTLALEVFPGRILFIGGEVNRGQQTANGPLAENMLGQLKVNKTFISAGGVSSVDGITDYDLHEASISRKMMERSQERIILADHSKLGKSMLAHVCPLDAASIFVTDGALSPEWRSLFAERGVEVLVAGSAAG